MAVDNISYNGVEDSIAQEFQPFVVDGTSFFGAHGDGFMQQSLLIDLDVTWKEAENSVKQNKTLYPCGTRALFYLFGYVTRPYYSAYFLKMTHAL